MFYWLAPNHVISFVPMLGISLNPHHPRPTPPLRSNSTQAPRTLSSLGNLENSQLWEEWQKKKKKKRKGQKHKGGDVSSIRAWKKLTFQISLVEILKKIKTRSLNHICPKEVKILYTSFKEASFWFLESLEAMGLVLFSTIPLSMSHFPLLLALEASSVQVTLEQHRLELCEYWSEQFKRVLFKGQLCCWDLSMWRADWLQLHVHFQQYIRSVLQPLSSRVNYIYNHLGYVSKEKTMKKVEDTVRGTFSFSLYFF